MNTNSSRTAWLRPWGVLLFMGSAPLRMQKEGPTREQADTFLEKFVADRK